MHPVCQRQGVTGERSRCTLSATKQVHLVCQRQGETGERNRYFLSASGRTPQGSDVGVPCQWQGTVTGELSRTTTTEGLPWHRTVSAIVGPSVFVCDLGFPWVHIRPLLVRHTSLSWVVLVCVRRAGFQGHLTKFFHRQPPASVFKGARVHQDCLRVSPGGSWRGPVSSAPGWVVGTTVLREWRVLGDVLPVGILMLTQRPLEEKKEVEILW